MSLQLKFKGFDYSAYYNGAYENANSLAALVQTGANAIETTLDWGINPQNFTVYRDSAFTDALAAEAATIKQAVALGLSVMVKPHLDFVNSAVLKGTPYSVDEWRTYFNPGAAKSASADTFFASYKTMLLQEASVAASSGATCLCIGTELDQICGPSYKSYWDNIISTLRSQYPSLKLTYAADWDSAVSPWKWGGTGLPAGTGNLATQISFASELDYFGVDCYAPLSNSSAPTLQQLINGWTQTPVNSGATAETYSVTGSQSLIAYLQGVAAAAGKPLIFTELGFDNAGDAASSPPYTQTNVENDKLQALLYQATFQAWSQAGNGALNGLFLYNWDPNAAEVGPGSIAFSPQNLPALNVVKQYFDTVSVSAPGTVNSGYQIPVAIGGVSVSESVPGQTLTVVLTASNGLLAANASAANGGGTVAGSGSAKLTVTGTPAQINADLTTLTYRATSAASDTVAVNVTSSDGATGSASIALAYDANYPVLQFLSAGNLAGGKLTFKGTVNLGNAGRTVTLFVNGAAAGAATADAKGNWSIAGAIPSSDVGAAPAVVTAAVTDAAGVTGVTPRLMVAINGGATANFSAANGNVVDFFNAQGHADTVNGSNGTVVLYASQAVVNGSGNNIYTDSAATDSVTLAGANNAVNGYGIAVAFGANSSGGSVTGDNNTITAASGGSLTLTGNNDLLAFLGAGDSANVSGSNETFLYQAQFGAQQIGGFSASNHDVISLAASEFANFATLSAASVQSGANVVISGANHDVLTLLNVSLASLTSAQFQFH